jgi:hypothetical protein
VNVSLQDGVINLSNIISAYGRDVNALLGKEKVNLLYPATIEELKRRILQGSTGPNSPLNAPSTASDANVENSSESAKGNDKNSDNLSFRRVNPVDDAFRQQWDALIASRVFLHTETMVDYLNAVKEFQRLIAERNGIEVMDFEDAYSALIAKTSKDRVEMEAFDRDVLQPLQASIRKLVGNVGKKMDWSKGALRELEVYIKCKHAIERNRDMAVREAIGESNMSESAKRIAIKDWENRRTLCLKYKRMARISLWEYILIKLVEM